MRTARALLLVCLAVGLAAVWSTSLGHHGVLEEAEERSLKSRLESRASSIADSLDASFADDAPEPTRLMDYDGDLSPATEPTQLYEYDED